MLGAIVGSVYEARPITATKFPLFHPRCPFTDDRCSRSPWLTT
jgi:hypothetical protein